MKPFSLWCVWLLFLIGRTEASDLSNVLGKLDKEENYTEMVRLFEGSKKAADDLAGEELALVVSGYFGVNDYAKIMELSELVLAKCPKDELAVRICMFAARKINRDKQGLELGLRWIAGNESGKGIYKDIAIAYCDVSDYPNAVKFGKIAAERLPDDQRPKGVYVYALARVEGVDAAFGYYEEIKKEIPEPGIYFLVQFAKGVFDQKDYPRLLPVLEEILAREPSEVDASRMKIAALKKTGKRDDAKKYAEKWISQYKPDAVWCNEYGSVLFQSDDFSKAREYFEKAIYWDEWYSTAVENLLVTLNELKEYGFTIQYASKWKLDHESAWTGKMDTQIGHSYTWMSLYDLAEIYYRRALKNNPDAFEQVRDVMFTVRKQDRAEEAIALGEAWLAKHPAGAEGRDEIELGVAKAKELLSQVEAKTGKGESR